jgi:hypothetical protein
MLQVPDVSDWDHSTLEFQLWDHNKLSADSLVGEFNVTGGFLLHLKVRFYHSKVGPLCNALSNSRRTRKHRAVYAFSSHELIFKE